MSRLPGIGAFVLLSLLLALGVVAPVGAADEVKQAVEEGLWLLEQNKAGAAQKLFEKLRLAHPDRVEPYYGMMLIQLAAGDYAGLGKTRAELARAMEEGRIAFSPVFNLMTGQEPLGDDMGFLSLFFGLDPEAMGRTLLYFLIEEHRLLEPNFAQADPKARKSYAEGLRRVKAGGGGLNFDEAVSFFDEARRHDPAFVAPLPALIFAKLSTAFADSGGPDGLLGGAESAQAVRGDFERIGQRARAWAKLAPEEAVPPFLERIAGFFLDLEAISRFEDEMAVLLEEVAEEAGGGDGGVTSVPPYDEEAGRRLASVKERLERVAARCEEKARSYPDPSPMRAMFRKLAEMLAGSAVSLAEAAQELEQAAKTFWEHDSPLDELAEPMGDPEGFSPALAQQLLEKVEGREKRLGEQAGSLQSPLWRAMAERMLSLDQAFVRSVRASLEDQEISPAEAEDLVSTYFVRGRQHVYQLDDPFMSRQLELLERDLAREFFAQLLQPAKAALAAEPHDHHKLLFLFPLVVSIMAGEAPGPEWIPLLGDLHKRLPFAGLDKLSDLIAAAPVDRLLIRTSEALEKYRHAHGEFPRGRAEELPALLPEVTTELRDLLARSSFAWYQGEEESFHLEVHLAKPPGYAAAVTPKGLQGGTARLSLSIMSPLILSFTLFQPIHADLGVFHYFYSGTAPVEEAKKALGKVVEAVQRFHDQQGRYPAPYDEKRPPPGFGSRKRVYEVIAPLIGGEVSEAMAMARKIGDKEAKGELRFLHALSLLISGRLEAYDKAAAKIAAPDEERGLAARLRASVERDRSLLQAAAKAPSFADFAAWVLTTIPVLRQVQRSAELDTYEACRVAVPKLDELYRLADGHPDQPLGPWLLAGLYAEFGALLVRCTAEELQIAEPDDLEAKARSIALRHAESLLARFPHDPSANHLSALLRTPPGALDPASPLGTGPPSEAPREARWYDYLAHRAFQELPLDRQGNVAGEFLRQAQASAPAPWRADLIASLDALAKLLPVWQRFEEAAYFINVDLCGEPPCDPNAVDGAIATLLAELRNQKEWVIKSRQTPAGWEVFAAAGVPPRQRVELVVGEDGARLSYDPPPSSFRDDIAVRLHEGSSLIPLLPLGAVLDVYLPAKWYYEEKLPFARADAVTFTALVAEEASGAQEPQGGADSWLEQLQPLAGGRVVGYRPIGDGFVVEAKARGRRGTKLVATREKIEAK